MNFSAGEENYTQLEKIVQKYEGEIRNHIRVYQLSILIVIG